MFDDSNDLAVHVAMDNTVVIDDLSKSLSFLQNLSTIANVKKDR